MVNIDDCWMTHDRDATMVEGDGGQFGERLASRTFAQQLKQLVARFE